MRFTIHTGLKRTPFELHQGRKPPRTELTNIVKDKSYLSDWSEISVFAPKRPQIPIYVGRDADVEISNLMIMARMKTEDTFGFEDQITEEECYGKIPIQLCSEEST